MSQGRKPVYETNSRKLKFLRRTMRRVRTTKERARRIDLMYFARPHPLRQWRFWLSCAIPVLALGWLFTLHAQGGEKAFSSGPLSRSHAVFTQQCALCHLRQTGS